VGLALSRRSRWRKLLRQRMDAATFVLQELLDSGCEHKVVDS
jgi:hypothetical protein